ncbi:MAG: SDR family NAD(P)-dependent oxidoreductase, partial [Caldilinea sp.]|nr:SDR family NAD(P)-dependent oxidoreductase [Caldilinea sp.]
MNHYASLFDLSGRTALIVGAGSGIGQASAQALAAFGAHVVCADIAVDAARSTVAAIVDGGGSAAAAPVDLRDRGQIDDLVTSLPALDILVSTPSINVRKPMLELTEEDFDRVIGLNLRGTFSLLRAGGRRMAAAGRGS